MALSRSRSVAAAVLVGAVALGVGSTATAASRGDAFVSRSTLSVVDGAVFTSRGGDGFTRARENDVVAVGDIVRTGPGSVAEITYVDGSSVRLEGDADFVVEKMSRSDGEVPRMLGRAWQVITKLLAGDSRYQMRTPTASASVRG